MHVARLHFEQLYWYGLVTQGCAPDEALAWLKRALMDAEELQAQAVELEFGKELMALNVAASYPEIGDLKQVVPPFQSIFSACYSAPCQSSSGQFLRRNDSTCL